MPHQTDSVIRSQKYKKETLELKKTITNEKILESAHSLFELVEESSVKKTDKIMKSVLYRKKWKMNWVLEKRAEHQHAHMGRMPGQEKEMSRKDI